MDERELANQVFQLVNQTAYRHSARRVLNVQIAIGGCRTFDLNRLSRTFGEVARGTVADGARLTIHVMPVLHRCRACGTEFDGTSADSPCPACGHPHTELLHGKEVRVLNIEVEDRVA